jgi:hypothetical protein
MHTAIRRAGCSSIHTVSEVTLLPPMTPEASLCPQPYVTEVIKDTPPPPGPAPAPTPTPPPLPPPPPPPAPLPTAINITVAVDWSAPPLRSSAYTSATVEGEPAAPPRPNNASLPAPACLIVNPACLPLGCPAASYYTATSRVTEPCMCRSRRHAISQPQR